jgi:CubicO group peptidase (beta-lactamase class C family)
MKKLVMYIFCVNIFFATLAQQPSFIANELDNYIEAGMKAWQVPGLAIVIVKDGQIVVSKGYGVRNIFTKEPVDDKTSFFIASNSKLFTGTALANLEYEKKLSLDDKMTRHFPWFKLFDKTSTELVTVKDMLTHRIGTKTFQGDFTFWNTTLTRKQIMEKMRLLKPSTGFREVYGYCNSCYLSAGEVVGKVSGSSWEKYITDKILLPLQMTSTYASSNGIQHKLKNIATPYTTSYTNALNQVPYDTWDNLGPAASIVSNVSDLSHWLQMQLDSGKYNGKQILPWAVLQRTRDVQIVTGSRKSNVYPIHFRGYGLGIFAADYNGQQVYWHTGGAGGQVSNVCFVPEQRLGIAILTNNDNQSFFEALRYQILDAYTGVPFVNRSEMLLTSHNKDMEAQVEEIEAWRKQAELAKLADTVVVSGKKFLGRYMHPLYGHITIERSTEATYTFDIKFSNHPNLIGRIKSLGSSEKWLCEYNNVEYGVYPINFTFDKTGNAISVKIKVNDFVEYDTYEFIRAK